MDLTVAVAIPTYNREEVLVDTIQYLFRQDPPADEILVVDQTKEHEPQVAAFLKENHDRGRIRWIRHSPPSAQGARNRALLETQCEVVIIIDDDVTMEKSFVSEHVKNYRDPRVAGVAGRTLCRDTPSGAALWRMPMRGSTLYDFKFFRLDGTQRVEGVGNWVTANCSVRRSSIMAIRGFDESYVGSVLDDVDTALRLGANGGIVVFEPRACVFHLMATTGGLGARIRNRRPSWKAYFPYHYFYVRHIFPRLPFWLDVPFVNFRRLVLTRENVKRPWRVLLGTVLYIYALVRAVLTFPKLLNAQRARADG